MDISANRQTLFRELYQQYFAMVKQLCLGYQNGDKDTAQDLTQEVFINVWNGLEKFRGEASHKTWIYRIAVNTCLLYVRNANKQPAITELGTGHFELSQEVNNDDERFEVLYRTIGSLLPLERIIIMMVLEEMPYEEMAAITGVNPVNLRVKIHRIKNKIRQEIKEN